MKIAVVNTKGGVGKTTAAVHLAVMLAGNAPTLLIDADPQASAASWAAWRREAGLEPSPTTTCLLGRAVFDEGKNLASGFAHTVVDAGGRDSAGLRGALLLANQAVVPVGVSNFDGAALTDLLEIVDLAKDFNQGLDVRVLLMRVDPRTKDAGDMLDFLREHHLRVFNTRICERVVFRRSTGEGSTVLEFGKDGQAVQEIRAFFDEVTA